MMKRALACRFVLRRMPSLINFRIQPLMPHESRTGGLRSGLVKLFKVRIGLGCEGRHGGTRWLYRNKEEQGQERWRRSRGKRSSEKWRRERKMEKVVSEQERKGRRRRAVI